MKKQKIIKLINNERMNRSVKSIIACDSTSTDFCQTIDAAVCTISSYDLCVKDYKGCTNNSTDYCASVRDITPCSDGSTDF